MTEFLSLKSLIEKDKTLDTLTHLSRSELSQVGDAFIDRLIQSFVDDQVKTAELDSETWAPVDPDPFWALVPIVLINLGMLD